MPIIESKIVLSVILGILFFTKLKILFTFILNSKKLLSFSTLSKKVSTLLVKKNIIAKLAKIKVNVINKAMPFFIYYPF